MGSNEDKNVLKHLLSLEGEAAALVNDAQAEADRRLAEAEKQSRTLFDREYSAEAEKLEAAYVREIAKVNEDYKNNLNVYLDGLKSQNVNKSAFNTLANQFLERK